MKKLPLLIALLTSLMTIPTAHSVYSCVDVKNEIIRENRKLAALTNRRERLEYRFEYQAFVYQTRIESFTEAVRSAVAHQQAVEEQIVRMGYGCVLDPVPCDIRGARQSLNAITRARSAITRARKSLDSASDTYNRFVAEQFPNTRVLDDRIESTRTYIEKLQFTLEICAEQ